MTGGRSPGRPRSRAASWHPYTQMLTRPDAAADRPRRGRLPLHRRRPPAARRHLVVVGEHPRPLASAAERGARRAGARARARDVRRLHASRRRSNWPSGCVEVAAARPDARVLLGQRIDGRRSRAEAGAASTGATAASRARRTFITLHHAYHGDTVGAMSASEDSMFTRPFAPMLFDGACARTRRTATAARSGSNARPAAIDCLGRALEARCSREHGDTIAGGARRADAAGRRRHDRLAAPSFWRASGGCAIATAR